MKSVEEYRSLITQLVMQGNFAELQAVVNEINKSVVDMKEETAILEDKLKKYKSDIQEFEILNVKTQQLLKSISTAVNSFKDNKEIMVEKANLEVTKVEAKFEEPIKVPEVPEVSEVPEVPEIKIEEVIKEEKSEISLDKVLEGIDLSNSISIEKDEEEFSLPDFDAIDQKEEEIDINLDSFNFEDDSEEKTDGLDDILNNLSIDLSSDEPSETDIDSLLKNI